ncbi:DUF3800 domain-containing protein [Curtobacterium sp. Curtsp57]|uniref:DUF3800 domain-containing protein n=1 Tax=Curtobacterium sp. Curtsp57 TaxID=3243047 RepID=UPI0039B4E51C
MATLGRETVSTTFVARPQPTTSRPRVLAFVDETGDRGVGPTSSRFFAMAGVSIAEEAYPQLQRAVIYLRQQLRVPANKALHWQEHVKRFSRRQFVTTTLTAVPGIVLNYVIFEKAAIPATAGLRSSQATFYNYTAGLLMERLLLTAEHWPGGARDLKVDLGHVRGFNHDETLNYFALKRSRAQGPANWGLLEGVPRFLGMMSNGGMQAADQFAGMLSAALKPDEFGGFEPQHLLHARPLIRRNWQGRSDGYGFKVMAQPNTMSSFPWWPSGGV